MTENDKFLEEHKLKDVSKRLQQIVEYTFITTPTLSEDDDDQEEQQAPQDRTQTDDANTGDMQQQPQQGNDDVEVSDVPDESEDETQQHPEEQDGEVELSQMQDGDEVIDVDDLTNSQKETEYKIDGVDDKLLRLAKVTDKLLTALELNNKKIEDLRADFEKRNPTEDEKLNLRSQASYPYSVKPKDYWDNKSKDSNYDVMYNNNVDPDKEDKEYVLKKSDVVSGMDDRSVSKSMNIPHTIEDYFDLF